jgi:alpha-beta hydrolase superfamily lysophospholipase
MQSNLLSNDLEWIKLDDNIFVSSFLSFAGSRIYLKYIEARKRADKNKVIFLCHDLCSYHGRFDKLVDWLSFHHPEVSFVLFDSSGHGLSTGTRVHIEDFNYLTEDLILMFKYFNKNKGDEWIALGQGLGAMVIIDALAQREECKNLIDKIILSNFAFQFESQIFNFEKKIENKIGFIKKIIGSSRVIKFISASKLVSSTVEQAKILKDPLMNYQPTYKTISAVKEKAKNLYQDAYFLDKPTLVLTSKSCYSTSIGMRSFSKGLKKELISEKNYVNFKHDLYNESDNEIIFNDISVWMNNENEN